MKEIRNTDGRLVCQINEEKKEVVIRVKGCVTQIHIQPDGAMEVINK